ncbi:transposase [Teichococcus aestuarii]|uniref:transposase n=1 Tax=Teichococcus aestuarii TaxID=568898 RepID=UPI001FECFE09|nr:transposase [Pseudoroseomonas aestuarii]
MVIVERARSARLIGAAPVAAVDATGLETRHISEHFGKRRGGRKGSGHRQRAWPKLTAVLHTHSHLIIGAVTGLGPSQDSPDFTPALRQAAAIIALDTVLADAGYDAEHNHRLCQDELGIKRSIIALNRRNTGRRWPKTTHRRALRQHFPRALYHQRWHIESGFSQHKRRLGSALTARSHQSQRRELILRVLTHNLMILRSRQKVSTEQSGLLKAPLAWLNW